MTRRTKKTVKASEYAGKKSPGRPRKDASAKRTVTATPAKQTGRAGKSPASLHDQIREKAYFQYVNRGRGPGFELDDWYEAENELRSQERKKEK